jgi:pyruvate kinase
MTLIEHGLEGAVVQLSRQSPQGARELCDTFKRSREQLGVNCPLVLETRGPLLKTLEVRLPISLKAGDELTLSSDLSRDQSARQLTVQCDDLASLVQPDSILYLDRGNIAAVVKSVKATEVELQLLSGGSVQGEITVTIPGADIQKPVLAQADLFDLQEVQSEAVLLSGVRKGEDVEQARAAAGNRFCIAKVENQLALQNYEEILEKADAVAIDRQMLNLELPPEKAFVAQKWMVEKAVIQGKPCLLINQVLESMAATSHPTRLEASGLRNLIQDGADGFIMGREVEVGEYPVNALMYAAKIAA